MKQASTDNKVLIRLLDQEGATVLSETSLQTSTLMISRDPDADICLPTELIASIELQQNTALLHSKTAIAVNGVATQTCSLAKNDQLQLSANTALSYRGYNETKGHIFDLMGEEPINRILPITKKKVRPIFWQACLYSLILFIVMLPWTIPNQSTSEASNVSKLLEPVLSSGPLHKAHSQVSETCSDCHRENSTAVNNAQCFACHTMKRHLTREQTGNHPHCITCHKEHNEPSNLLNKDSRLCTQCHNNFDQVLAVLATGQQHQLTPIDDFVDNHPDFSQPTSAKASINFSHQQHMTSEKIVTPLDCSSCHQVDRSGEKMLPIAMVKHCQSCHQPEYRNQMRNFELPHGDFALLSLTLAEQLSITDAKKLEQTMNPIVRGETCNQCHRHTTGFSADQYEKYQQDWQYRYSDFKHTHFSHKQHEAKSQCLNCHSNANSSLLAEDNLMPVKKTCESCHSSDGSNNTLQTECSQCHQFHTIDWL